MGIILQVQNYFVFKNSVAHDKKFKWFTENTPCLMI